MMIKKTIDSFNTNCNEILESNDTMLNKASKGITLCNQTLTTLKEIVDKKDFNTVPEEIDFFKNYKPVPMSLLIFFTEVRSCELRMPKAGTTYKVQFLQKELRKINKFFFKNADFVHFIEPYFNWRHLYIASEDSLSPFYDREYSEFEFTDRIYNFLIHPQWDNIGSRTLFAKILLDPDAV